MKELLEINISPQMLRCVKSSLLAYKTYAVQGNFLRALPLGKLRILRGSLA
ncbi:MAG: hypothetical protein Q7S46_07385 [Gallionella sp.]|nr:hypothetical protein [Gallionella sp.]